jgi:hypothetical protein
MAVVAMFYFSGLAAAHDYVGAEKCKMCHKGEAKGKVWEIWEASAHAKAYKTLVAKGDGSETKAECLTCHTTGMGKSTGFAAGDTTKVHLTGVGCESCHGPGADYKAMAVMKDSAKAKEAGLITPAEETCKTCHNDKSPTFKGFDFAEYSKKIEHRVPKKTE